MNVASSSPTTNGSSIGTSHGPGVDAVADLRAARAEIERVRVEALREGFEIAVVHVEVITSDEAGNVNPWADFARARTALEKRIEGSGR